MLDRGYYEFDVEVDIKGLKPLVDELPTIVCYYRVWYAEPTHDTSPQEVLHILGGNGCEWFDLDPFCKVIDSNKEELGLPLPWCEGVDDVHFPKWRTGMGTCGCATFLV